MKQFLHVLLILGLALVSGMLSASLVFIVAWLNNYEAEGPATLLWVLASFLLGFIVALVLAITLPTKVIGVNKFISIPLFVMIISLIAHQFVISSDLHLGSYYLPPGFSAAKMANKELEKLVFNRNNEIGFQAFLELEKRGAKASDSLLHIIQRNTADDPDGFIDMYTTQEAVRILAAQKDKRALPILQEMLKSSEHHDSDYMGTHTTFYTTRIFAKKLLKKYFGIKSNVVTEKRVSPKRENHRNAGTQ